MLPTSARPIVTTVEILTALSPRSLAGNQALSSTSELTRSILKLSLRVSINALFVVIAIVFPSFDRIMALMGSMLCFTICIILPLCFYLKIFGNSIPLQERILDYALIMVCSVLALVGTTWAFLPRESVGAT